MLNERRTFVFFAILLIVPFLMREGYIFEGLGEPYPAVLFPAGSGKTRIVDGQLRLSKGNIYSIDQHGEKHKLGIRSFFHPIPIVYWTNMANPERRFGLLRTDISGTDRMEVLRWIRERLVAVGRPNDPYLLVSFTTSAVDTVSGKEVDSREVAYRLEVPTDGGFSH